jgi:hypothetical protein
LEFRRGILGKYNALFGGLEDGDGSGFKDDYKGLSKKEIIELKKIEEQEKRFQWYSFIYALADGDITKFDKIIDLNFIMCLNHLSFKKTFKK